MKAQERHRSRVVSRGFPRIKAEALALVQQALAANDPYALAFMDIRMPPGWDGVETIERIWQGLSGFADGALLGVSDYTGRSHPSFWPH